MWIEENIKHKIKWKVGDCYISDKNILFDKNHNRKKQCVKNGNIGYYLGRKFTILKHIKKNCNKLIEIKTPF